MVGTRTCVQVPIPEFLSVENAIATRLSLGPFVDTFELHLFKRMPHRDRGFAAAPTEAAAVRHERRSRTIKPRKTLWLKRITTIHRCAGDQIPPPDERRRARAAESPSPRRPQLSPTANRMGSATRRVQPVCECVALLLKGWCARCVSGRGLRR